MLDAAPFPESIASVNRWYDEGHIICFFTARTDEHASATEAWLKKHGVKYHKVIYNKPRKIAPYTEYHFIDDTPVRATRFTGKMGAFVRKAKEIEVFEE